MRDPESPRLTRAERNHRRREAAQWTHAMERLRERHAADATYEELTALAEAAVKVFEDWRRRVNGPLGRVLRVEGADSALVRVQFRGLWIRVVLCPLNGVIRTVLPPESPPQYADALGNYPGAAALRRLAENDSPQEK